MSKSTITEAGLLVNNLASVGARKMRIRIIEGDRWGSSGYYPADVLKRDGPKAFPAGTQMFLDHPSYSEEEDRPERSIRDLAGVTESAASYDKDGLYADVIVYEHWAPVIREMAKDIGVSIRAVAEVEDGTIGGDTGSIVKSLIEGLSIDYVTKAGAGGKVVQLIESARRKVEDPVKEANSQNRRTQLDWALKHTYTAESGQFAYVRDFDESKREAYFVVYNDSTGREGTFAQKWKPINNDTAIEFVGERWEVLQQTEYVPTPPTKPVPTIQPAQESDLKETQEKGVAMGNVEIEESELRTLRESAQRGDTLTTQLEEARKESKDNAVLAAREARRANREQARRIVGECLTEAKVKAPSLASAFSVDPPLIAEGADGAGTVDEATLKEQVKEAIGEITVEVDESTGGVRGFGASAANSQEVSESDLDTMSAGIFGREIAKG